MEARNPSNSFFVAPSLFDLAPGVRIAEHCRPPQARGSKVGSAGLPLLIRRIVALVAEESKQHAKPPLRELAYLSARALSPSLVETGEGPDCRPTGHYLSGEIGGANQPPTICWWPNGESWRYSDGESILVLSSIGECIVTNGESSKQND